MEYICFTCGKLVDLKEISKRIRCPYCGGKILFKQKPEMVRHVKARWKNIGVGHTLYLSLKAIKMQKIYIGL